MFGDIAYEEPTEDDIKHMLGESQCVTQHNYSSILFTKTIRSTMIC